MRKFLSILLVSVAVFAYRGAHAAALLTVQWKCQAKAWMETNRTNPQPFRKSAALKVIAAFDENFELVPEASTVSAVNDRALSLAITQKTVRIDSNAGAAGWDGNYPGTFLTIELAPDQVSWLIAKLGGKKAAQFPAPIVSDALALDLLYAVPARETSAGTWTSSQDWGTGHPLCRRRLAKNPFESLAQFGTLFPKYCRFLSPLEATTMNPAVRGTYEVPGRSDGLKYHLVLSCQDKGSR